MCINICIHIYIYICICIHISAIYKKHGYSIYDYHDYLEEIYLIYRSKYTKNVLRGLWPPQE